jgi:hypothetical protein
MNKLIFILIIIFSDLLFSQDYEFFNELKKETNLEWDEKLIIIYQNLGNCNKCYLEPMEIIYNVTSICPDIKYKILALVRCDRKIELKVYKRDHDWKYYMFRDDGRARKKLLADNETIITLLDSNGRNLLNIKGGDMHSGIKLLRNTISK